MDILDHRLHVLHIAASELSAGISRLREDLGSTSSEMPRQAVDTPISPCSTCAQYDTCTKPCEAVERLLATEDAGRTPRRSQTDVPLDVLQHYGFRTGNSRDVFDRFLACRPQLTAKRWQVVELVYGEGLTQKEAARRLGKSQGTVAELLAGALDVLEKFERAEKKRLRGSGEQAEPD